MPKNDEDSGQTPLHYVAEFNASVELIKELIK